MGMSEDSFRIRTPLFSFGITKKEVETEITIGKPVLLKFWSWKKIGHIRKLITVKEDLTVVVQVL